MAIQIIREVSADVVKRGATRAVYAKQHDFNSRFLNIRIQEDGTDIVVDPALTVVLNVERPDQEENIFYGTVNEDGTVKVPLTSWMLELEGTLVCDVSLISEDPTIARLSTMQFNIYVEAATVSDEDIEGSEEYSIWVDLITKTSEAEQKASEAAAHIAQLEELCVNAAATAESAAQNAAAAEQSASEAREAATKIIDGYIIKSDVTEIVVVSALPANPKPSTMYVIV